LLEGQPLFTCISLCLKHAKEVSFAPRALHSASYSRVGGVKLYIGQAHDEDALFLW
jgi:hypothetical protein